MRAPGYIRTPFATTGDVTPVPIPAQPNGAISMATGWGPNYQADPASDPQAKNIGRQEMNYLFNLLSAILQRWQVEAFPEWIAPADNAGTPVGYNLGTIVRYPVAGGRFVLRMSNVENNTATPSDSGSTLAWFDPMGNPTTTTRGMPLAATLADLRNGASGLMVTPDVL